MAEDLKKAVIRKLKGRSRQEILQLSEEIDGVSFAMLYQLALGVYRSEPTYKRLAAINRRLDELAA